MRCGLRCSHASAAAKRFSVPDWVSAVSSLLRFRHDDRCNSASNSKNSESLANMLNTSKEPIINPQAYIKSIFKNSYGYSSFDLRLVLNYINNQLTYYYATEVIFRDDQPHFH